MSIRSLDELYVRGGEPPLMAVAAAQEADVLVAVSRAVGDGVVRALLLGDGGVIKRVADEHDIDIAPMDIVDTGGDAGAAAAEAVGLVSRGEVHLLMKGLVDTSILLKSVLDPDVGLRTGRVLSHVALFEVSGHDRILTVTDAAMNIAPDLDQKQEILVNAVEFLRSLGYEEPNVAVLAAKEKVNPKMPDTVDAGELQRRNREGTIAGCRVAGPLALDNAVSVEAARTKGIDDPVAGRADVLLAPDIEAGNILYKSLSFLAGARSAGVIVGAAAPVVLTSRADSAQTKLDSIAVAARAARTVA